MKRVDPKGRNWEFGIEHWSDHLCGPLSPCAFVVLPYVTNNSATAQEIRL
jgi:hypothetical protein